LRNARAFPLLPAALASVSFGFVLVRVRVLKLPINHQASGGFGLEYIHDIILKYRIYGTKGFYCTIFGGVWSLGALCCPPRERFLFQIHTQEAGPSQGPFERIALNSPLKIADPAMVKAVVPL